MIWMMKQGISRMSFHLEKVINMKWKKKQGVPDSLPPDDIPPDDLHQTTSTRRLPPDDFPPDFGDEILPGEEKSPLPPPYRSKPGTPSPSYKSTLSTPPSSPPPSCDADTDDLRTLNRFLNANKHKPNAKISTPKSMFFNWDRNMAKARVNEIFQKRRSKVVDDFEKRNTGKFLGLSHKERRNWVGLEEKSVAEVAEVETF